MDSLKNNQTVKGIAGFVVFILVVFIIYKLYKYLKEQQKKRPYLVKGPKDATEAIVLEGKKIVPSDIGLEMSYSFWIYVKDWGHNFSKPKHVFHVGDKDGNNVAPGVWLYPKNNNIMIRMDTYNRVNNVSKTVSGKKCQNWQSMYPHKGTKNYSQRRYPNADLGNHNFCRNPDNKENAWCFTEDPDMEKEDCKLKDHRMAPSMNPSRNEAMLDQQKQCDLVNIPVQRWVHVAIVLVNKTLDVYLNGKLSRSCTLDDVPKLNKGDIYINLDGGFNGELSDLLYTNQAFTAKEVYNLYLSGYNAFSLLSKLGDYEPKMKLKLNVNVNVSAGSGDGNKVPVEEANNK